MPLNKNVVSMLLLTISCHKKKKKKKLPCYLGSGAMMLYLPMSFRQEFCAQMVVGPTPPYEMDNSLMMPSPSPKKTLIPELTIARAFCCRWACRKADTNSHWKPKRSGACGNTPNF